ncbi:hypothetical protein LIT25_12030 [Bacillus sp. F19]|nr:hypothetical protein LIT25_12030 [Bacillus sp. F19]
MNNFQWINTLFNLGRSQPFLNMFGRRRRNRGMVWASIVGLGISAAVFGLRRNQNRNLLSPIQNLVNNFRQNNLQNPVSISNKTAFAEFSNELTPNINMNKNK